MIEIPRYALSLKQPWAWAVFEPSVDKDVENRTWSTNITGPILIAASAQVTAREYAVASDFIEELTGIAPPPKSELPHGCIVGRVSIGKVLAPTTKPKWRWHMPDLYGFPMVQKDRLVEPVPCKGLQRFWLVGRDRELVARLGFASLVRVGGGA